MIYDKEAVYDTEISPLMKEIIGICQREKIPFAAVFAIKDDGEEGPLFCTTILDGDSVDPDTPGLDTIKRVREVAGPKERVHFSMAVQIRGDSHGE
jgi:hypothetical protein